MAKCIFFFCLGQILECVLNSLIKKLNYFERPWLTLSNENQIPKGICGIRVRELHELTTSTLINDINFSKKVVWPSNLEQQQVVPDLMLLTPQITLFLISPFDKLSEGAEIFYK